MSNTGPAELAELVHDDKKFRTYMVLVTQEIKAEQKQHALDDKQRFDERDLRMEKIETRVFGNQPSISSQVGSLKSEREQVIGAKRILQIVGIFFAWIISTGIAIWAARK